MGNSYENCKRYLWIIFKTVATEPYQFRGKRRNEKEWKQDGNKISYLSNLDKRYEHIVKDAIEMWKSIYHLHKPTNDTIEIKDDDSDQEDDEDNYTPSITMDVTNEDL